MTEGSVVIVVGSLNKRIKDIPQGLVAGTFIGYVQDKKVLVLLADGDIFIGLERDLVPYETQA